jgi:hypothetical protein
VREREMAMEPNPYGQGLWDDREEPERVAKLNPDEEPAGSKTQPWFKPKKGSVIPVERRLVKRMMLDWLVQSLSSRTSVSAASQSDNTKGASKKLPPSKSSNEKKTSKIIYPNPS